MGEKLRTRISLVSLYLEAYTIEANSWWMFHRVIWAASYRNVISNLNGWLIQSRQIKREMNNLQWPDGVLKTRFDEAVAMAEKFIEKNRRRYW